MTSSNGNIFRVTGLCAGNSPVPGEFPTQRPVTRRFDVYFDLRLNKRLCKQSWGWWFETLLCPLWRHSNDIKWRKPLCGLTYSWIWTDWYCILNFCCWVPLIDALANHSDRNEPLTRRGVKLPLTVLRWPPECRLRLISLKLEVCVFAQYLTEQLHFEAKYLLT